MLKVEAEIGNKKYVYRRQPGSAYDLNRQEFICQLKREAKNFGAVIKTDDKIKSISDLNGDYIVDASGCPSTLKKELGLNKGIKGVTYQQTIENCNYFQKDTIKIIFLENFGYIWIFPRNETKKEINLGLGYIYDFNYNLKKILEDFKQSNKITGKVNYVCGGLIPLGLQPPLRYKNILFVGDAGVGAFPVSGQGIYRALISGDVAGKCIANFQPKKYSTIIYKYFYQWNFLCSTFGKINFVMWKINPKLTLRLFNLFIRSTGMTH